ncbi:MAG: hypothetical protein NVSMB1_22020 [Polyangiales bacterium]
MARSVPRTASAESRKSTVKPSSQSARVAHKPASDRPAAVWPAIGWITPHALEALLEVMARHDVSVFEQTHGSGAQRARLTIRRGQPEPEASYDSPPTTHARSGPSTGHSAAHSTAHAAVHGSPSVSPNAAEPAGRAAAGNEDGLVFVTSPLVGTYYGAPSPDAQPFVSVGTKIRPGQRLCIVEAMKLMNEIEAEIEGTVVEVLAEDGKPVEYGQKLFKVRQP